MLILDVPFKDKNRLKKIGDGQWNQQLKKWTIPDNINKRPYQEWLREPTILLKPPVYLLEAVYPYPCSHCHERNLFYTLAATGVDNIPPFKTGKNTSEFVVLSDIRTLPQSLLNDLKKPCPFFQENILPRDERYFYLNHCHECHSIMGLSFLNNPYMIILPKTQRDAEHITLYEISNDEPLSVNANYFHNEQTQKIRHYSPVKKLTELTNM